MAAPLCGSKRVILGLIRIVLAAAIIVGIASIGVSAAPKTSVPGSLPPIGDVPEGQFVNNPSSTIKIIRTIEAWINRRETTTCVYFLSDGSRAQSDATFVISYAGGTAYKDGKAGEDLLNVPGPFNVPMVAWATDITYIPVNCVVTVYGGTFAAAVTGVAFPDGTYWHIVPRIPAKVADSSESGAVLARASGLVGVVPTDRSTPETTRADPVPLYECVDLRNDGERSIVGVQVQFEHIGMSGENLAVDTVNVRQTIQPRGILKDQCNAFRGSTVPGLYHYAQAASHGAADHLPPTIIFKGQSSTLAVWVNAVYYAGGASWHRRA